MADLSVRLGPLRLKNPVIAGSSEFTMTEVGIRACLDAGAAAVVAKSINELPAAARQLDIADYALIASDRSVRPWESAQSTDSLLCRSGLAQTSLADWVSMLAGCRAYARTLGALMLGSITVAEPAPAAELATAMAPAVDAVELNLSAPHGREAADFAVRLLTDADVVRSYTEQVRAAVACPLVVKLTAQTSDVVALARAAADGGADAVAMIGRFPGFLPDLNTWEPVLGTWAAIGGGWSLPIALYWVSKTRRALPDLPIVGTNGARSGADVLRFLLSGAAAVEMASALLTHGAQVITQALGDVEAYADQRGLRALQHMIGAAADRARNYSDIAPLDPPSRPWQPLLPER